MSIATQLFELISSTLEGLPSANSVVAKPISDGSRHVVPLCELRLGLGGAVAQGEGDADSKQGRGQGTGGGGGGGVRARPTAVVIVEDGRVRIASLEG